jgi:hypothetical protein
MYEEASEFDKLNDNAYKLGMNARLEEMPASSNPFAKSTRDWAVWVFGWNEYDDILTK